MKARAWGVILLIVGMALSAISGWQLIRPSLYRATARIKIEKHISNISTHSLDPESELSRQNDDHIELQLEIIQSAVVLQRVVDSLDLNKELGKGSRLETAESVRFLKRRLSARRILQTHLVEISMVHEDPAMAAKLANAVATAYLEETHTHYRAQIQTFKLRGIKALEERLQEEETKIQAIQKEIRTLEENGGNSDILKDKRAVLGQISHFIRSLSQKIEAEKSELQTPGTTFTQFIDTAKPPTAPYGPNRLLAAVMLICSVTLSILGLRLLLQDIPPGPNFAREKFIGAGYLVFGATLCYLAISELAKPARYRAAAQVFLGTRNPGTSLTYQPNPANDTFDSIPVAVEKAATSLSENNTNAPIIRSYLMQGVEAHRASGSLGDISNAIFMEIQFTAEDPNKAAQAANAIARGYCDFQNSQMKTRQTRRVRAAMRTLAFNWQGISESDPAKLFQFLEAFAACAPKGPPVHITSTANPSMTHRTPNQLPHLALLFCGFGATLMGIRLIAFKSQRHNPASKP